MWRISNMRLKQQKQQNWIQVTFLNPQYNPLYFSIWLTKIGSAVKQLAKITMYSILNCNVQFCMCNNRILCDLFLFYYCPSIGCPALKYQHQPLKKRHWSTTNKDTSEWFQTLYTGAREWKLCHFLIYSIKNKITHQRVGTEVHCYISQNSHTLRPPSPFLSENLLLAILAVIAV